jgi:CheY-like chemotaxis protein
MVNDQRHGPNIFVRAVEGVDLMSQITMLSLDEKTITSELDRAGYRKMGISVRSANTFEEAAKMLETMHIDIIVMNMDHTKVDVLDAVKKIKSVKHWDSIPIVLTSVQSAPKIKQLAKKSGADLFVEQPLPRDYFIEKLKNLLSQQTRGQQRVQGSIAVSFIWRGKTHACDVGDLSLTGLLLSTDLEIPSGELLELQIMLGASNKPVKVKGEVVRQIQARKHGPGVDFGGIGVRFAAFQGDGQQRIESWVARTSDSSNKMAYYL